MVTAAETAGGIGLLLGLLTPLAACAVIAAMIDAWAVNVSAAAFWAEPFNVPFLIAVGAAALLFAGAGSYSVDAKIFGNWRVGVRVALGLLVVAVAAALLTWILLNGTNPIHFTEPGRLRTYPAVRIATIFRIVTQRILNGDCYCSVHVDRRHQC